VTPRARLRRFSNLSVSSHLGPNRVRYLVASFKNSSSLNNGSRPTELVVHVPWELQIPVQGMVEVRVESPSFSAWTGNTFPHCRRGHRSTEAACAGPAPDGCSWGLERPSHRGPSAAPRVGVSRVCTRTWGCRVSSTNRRAGECCSSAGTARLQRACLVSGACTGRNTFALVETTRRSGFRRLSPAPTESEPGGVSQRRPNTTLRMEEDAISKVDLCANTCERTR
jgi:hypothetical protein